MGTEGLAEEGGGGGRDPRAWSLRAGRFCERLARAPGPRGRGSEAPAAEGGVGWGGRARRALLWAGGRDRRAERGRPGSERGRWRLDPGAGLPLASDSRGVRLKGPGSWVAASVGAGWAAPLVPTWGPCFVVGGWVGRLVGCRREAWCQRGSDSLLWVPGVECDVGE